ncbi:MAG: hypothetical protein B7Y73_01350, partial [Acidocella sp. 35-58-6]
MLGAGTGVRFTQLGIGADQQRDCGAPATADGGLTIASSASPRASGNACATARAGDDARSP